MVIVSPCPRTVDFHAHIVTPNACIRQRAVLGAAALPGL
jgi:hypothetical protein